MYQHCFVLLSLLIEALEGVTHSALDPYAASKTHLVPCLDLGSVTAVEILKDLYDMVCRLK